MKKLFSKILREDNFLSLSGNLTLAVLGFGGFALLVRVLSTQDFAQWVIFVSGGSLVEMLRYGISNNGLVRFLSGAERENADQLIGTNVLLSLVTTILIVLIMIAIRYFFADSIDNSSYSLFFSWYPVLAFANLPLNNALVVQQAKMRYGSILIIKAFNSILFFAFLVFNWLFLNYGLVEIVIVFLGVNSLTSCLCVFKSWDGIKLIRKANQKNLNILLNFGKYSTFTLIGTNLLRNADVLIISLSPFGSTAVALFSIPLKLTEIQQIPLRSFAATAYPKMSKASLNGDMQSLKEIFDSYSGAITYLFFGISILTFVFAKEFVLLISGDQYLNAQGLGIDIVSIVQLLSVYGLLLPIDRMTGIGLDSLNKPNINALKVFIMLSANVAGDLIALYVLESVEMVAASTLVFTILGIVVGSFFLNKSFKVSIPGILRSGNRFYFSLWLQAKQLSKGIHLLD